MSFKKPDLLNDKPGLVIFSLALPMVIGIAANMSFNLVDSYFIGQLGVDQLAALGYSFPVVITLLNIAIGYGIGVSSVLSRLIGKNADSEQSRILGSFAFYLSILVACLIAISGVWTIEPLFRLLGADEDLLGFIHEYMKYAYWAMALRMVAMSLTAVFRAHGNTLIPSLSIVVIAGFNFVLDPILIFGLLGFPKLGIEGAGIATLLANALALGFEAYLCFFRYKLASLWPTNANQHLSQVKEVLRISGPAALSNALNPIANNFANWVLSFVGAVAVAGFGVAIKIQFFAFVPVLAMSAAIGPFVGQNFGNQKQDRVREALKKALTYSVFWVAFVSILLWLFGTELAQLFTDDKKAIAVTASYLNIVPLSLIGYASVVFSSSAANASGFPGRGLYYISLRTLIVFIPLAWILFQIYSYTGFFWAIALSNILAGALSLYNVKGSPIWKDK